MFLFDGEELDSEDVITLNEHAEALWDNPDFIVTVQGKCCTSKCGEDAVDVGTGSVVRRLLLGGARDSQIVVRNLHETHIKEGCLDADRHIELHYRKKLPP